MFVNDMAHCPNGSSFNGIHVWFLNKMWLVIMVVIVYRQLVVGPRSAREDSPDNAGLLQC